MEKERLIKVLMCESAEYEVETIRDTKTQRRKNSEQTEDTERSHTDGMLADVTLRAKQSMHCNI